MKKFNEIWEDEYEEWEVELLAVSVTLGTLLLIMSGVLQCFA